MYACIHALAAGNSSELLHLALAFCPIVEQTSKDTVVFSIAALRKLIGSPHQIASEICRLGHDRRLNASLAIAFNPDTAILLARNITGVTLVTQGDEAAKLATLPLSSLFAHDTPVEPGILDILHRWGLKTCQDFAALPESGVAERLGSDGIYLRNLACGKINRPLRVPAPETKYEERMELEHPIELLEPLLFLLGSALKELCVRLRAQSRAARLLEGHFDLEDRKVYRCELEFPAPLDDSATLLKLLQLHLERHGPEAPVMAFLLRIEPVEPKRVQREFFLPATPAADKLHVTLARIAGLVGKENVGTPVLLNTHRPDAFELHEFTPCALPAPNAPQEENRQEIILAMRLFRPALSARVTLCGFVPGKVVASSVKGNVLRSAGPWKTSGEWWTSTSWTREEWDVALDDGALYRIYRDSQTSDWYVHGVYD